MIVSTPMEPIATIATQVQKAVDRLDSGALIAKRANDILREWWVLCKTLAVLEKVGIVAPKYAQKIERDGEPDFQTYLEGMDPFVRIEVTDVHLLGRRLREEYSQPPEKLEGEPIFPHPQPWRSFIETVRKKLAKRYNEPGTWLIVHHNMWAFDFEDWDVPWERRILDETRSWVGASAACDLSKSRFGNLLVFNAAKGDAVVRLYPHWDVLKPQELEEENARPLFAGSSPTARCAVGNNASFDHPRHGSLRSGGEGGIRTLGRF